MSIKPLLSVRNLETQFRSQHGFVKAVNNISFDLMAGETVAIVGESGSGKSVTSLSLMQLINDPPGKITGGSAVLQSKKFGEVDLLKLPEKQMEKLRGSEISMIFQEPMTSLNPVYTCGRQVMEVLQLHENLSRKEAEARTLALFQQVKLPRPEKMLKAYPHEISGGQKQRVMIAMAMACEPSVLIADEPTTALDVTVQAHILELLNELRERKGTSILFITHDLGVVAEIADRVMVMYKGNIVEQGNVLDIFTNPQHPYTKALLACRPKIITFQPVLPTVSDFMEVLPTGEIVEKPFVKDDSLPGVVNNYIDTMAELKRKQLMQQSTKPLVKVDDLRVHFPIKKNFFGKVKEYVRAVDGVDFEIFPGETVGLVGESGCGKTTLGRTLLRLVEPTSGRIIFNDIDIAGLSQEALRKSRKNFQMVFQDPYASLNPMLTVGETIMEPMKVHNILKNGKERCEKVNELLETVGLTAAHFDRYPHEFSGGQRQRISIARALALSPKCIICDESVSALDVSVQAQVLNLLNKLKREMGITYLFITHDLSVAKYMSDRIFVMNQGRIIESGTPEQIFNQPQNDYTRDLIAAIPKGDVADIRKAQERRKGL
ncbi:ABC transporter ATP-binding protein [Adhaeribacter sp. BT258]|uniref:ABC transporter ATP-binding protein n=1 Tax=Adhaeribacter terrigena TaxID=2793070 RepID=A0ABS1C2M5_9BACT|nr:ABC transporter ATP-binding protein [Adhaeribacter terrigena]MBK0403574.1 ABC transporter ATP-binding protein [Adhaeribacter terrigena]